jgi:VanZ family protein
MSRLWRWVAVVLWASLIWTFSTDTFSRENTSSVFIPLLRRLLPFVNPNTIEFLHVALRKSAHVFEYFVFGWLLFRAIRGNRPGWTLRWAASALVVAAGFAASDEFHQLFVPRRGASVWDALLDTVAAAAAIFCVYLWARRSGTADTAAAKALAR